MIALLDLFEPKATGNGTLRVGNWCFKRPKSIKSPNNIQFPGMFRCRITEGKYFQLHDSTVSTVRAGQ